MTSDPDTLLGLMTVLESKAPELMQLLCAKSDDEFDSALDGFIERAVCCLETNRKNFVTLGEVGLSGVIAASLEMPGLTVTQEAHSNGHVDITIRADHCVPARKRLCEAKIYDGPAYHISGLEQLLTRYTTGREGRGIVLSYVRQKNISDLVLSIREKMDEELPCHQTEATKDHVLKWSFTSNHMHSCGDPLDVCHVSCNLYFEGMK